MASISDFVVGVLVFLTIAASIILVWYVITRRQRWRVELAGQQMESHDLESREIEQRVPGIANQFIVSIDGERRDDVFGKRGAVDQDFVNECLAEMSDIVDKPKHHDVVCSICLDELLDAPNSQCYIAPTCGHGFHLTCLGKWVYTRRDITCPNCKTPVFPINVEINAPVCGLEMEKSETVPTWGENMV
ncbi:hypothetical protein NDN08_007170 [Rhodosorus marinus]|uniref:RING-type domain-containing protein n=1 Tax=Rhodosorus marinus TaxID=101924 RepID=A0AAV8UJ02_9RHOD|nr:hypothetical protein NDN08_007170 [Rhodosorus marinus]